MNGDPAWGEFQKRLSLLLDSFYSLSPEDKPQAIGSVRESVNQMQSAVKQQLCSDAMKTVAAMAESMIQETYGIQPVNKNLSALDYLDNRLSSPVSVYTQLDQSTNDSNDILTSALYETLKNVGTEPEYCSGLQNVSSNYSDIINLNNPLKIVENNDGKCPTAATNFGSIQENISDWTNNNDSLDYSKTVDTTCSSKMSKPEDRQSIICPAGAENNFSQKMLFILNIVPNNTSDDCRILEIEKSIAENSTQLTCPICSCKIRHRQNLHRHLQMHKELDFDRKFNCDKCDKKFKTMWALKEHDRYKHSEKLLQCPQCEKSFAASKDLNRHAKTHSELRAFVCACGKNYKLKYHLTRHVLVAHAGKI